MRNWLPCCDICVSESPTHWVKWSRLDFGDIERRSLILEAKRWTPTRQHGMVDPTTSPVDTKEVSMVQTIRHLTGAARPGRPNDRPPAPAGPPPPRWRIWLLPAGVFITLALLSIPHMTSTPTKN